MASKTKTELQGFSSLLPRELISRVKVEAIRRNTSVRRVLADVLDRNLPKVAFSRRIDDETANGGE